jgi:hypothetical protein
VSREDCSWDGRCIPAVCFTAPESDLRRGRLNAHRDLPHTEGRHLPSGPRRRSFRPPFERGQSQASRRSTRQARLPRRVTARRPGGLNARSECSPARSFKAPDQPPRTPAERDQPPKGRRGVTATLPGGREFDPRSVLDRQHMPAGPAAASVGRLPSLGELRAVSPAFAGACAFGLAKNRPACSSPPRLPPNRRKQTVLSATIRSRIVPPFLEAHILECSERPFHLGSCSAGAGTYRTVLAPRRTRDFLIAIR